jgi:transposase
MRLVEATLQAFGVERPDRCGQHLCADKGYDYTAVRSVLEKAGYTLHIPSRGETPGPRHAPPHARARRWVVERTHSWMNRFRRLLVRWEKREQNYEAMLHLACAWITMKLAGVFG